MSNEPSSRTPERRTLAQRVAYDVARVLTRLIGVLAFRLRCFGREKAPATGGALVCANHQSFFDPVLVGLAFDRRLNYLARQSLFAFAPFRWLIRFFDAIPIEREGSGFGGLKETLRRLKRGEMVLIFPEGTRTRDGTIGPLKPGFCALVRRAEIPLVPVGLDGAYDAWPRSAKLPRRTEMSVCIGDPISPAHAAQLSDDELIAELDRRIRACHARARSARLLPARLAAKERKM